jgi:hypothetical protein
MKLFTKDIDKKLFAQFLKGGELANQKVIAKIFNPYGRGVWYIINSDPNDPDYLWAIVNLFEVEVGSVSRKELESLRIKPFMLPLERDLSFSERNALEVYKGVQEGERYEDGGRLSDSTYLVQMAEEYAENKYEKPVKKGEGITKAKKDGERLDYSEVTVYFKDGSSETFYRDEFEEFFDTDEYAKGGKTPLMLKYVSPRDIAILKITTDDGIKHLIKGESIISGEYKLAKGGKLSDNYVYIPKRNIDQVILKDGKTTDDKFNGFYVKKESLKSVESYSSEENDAVAQMKNAIAKVKSIKTLKSKEIANTLELANTFAFQDAVKKAIEENKKSEAIDVYADAINTLTKSNKYLVSQNLAEFGNPLAINLFSNKYVDVPSLKLKPIKRKQNVEDDETLLKQINKFTGDDSFRPNLTSIKFDNHSVVATDANTLVHIYNKTKVEPKQICISNLCTKNKGYNDKYPDWSSIIITYFDRLDSCEIDVNDFLKLAEFSENQFTNSNNKDNFGVFIPSIAVKLKEKNIFFQSRFIIKTMTTLKILGISKCKMFFGEGSNQPVYFTSIDANNFPLENDFVLIMPFLKLDESIKNFAIDCETGKYVIVGNKYAKGGITFDDKVKAVQNNLFSKEVPKKYRNLYGKTYDKTEAHKSAQKIIGAQVKKYKK